MRVRVCEHMAYVFSRNARVIICSKQAESFGFKDELAAGVCGGSERVFR